ncbi:MAG: hypothetical protein JWN14_3400 [Chthonomonadales bacterium]|nr:hypothetical protein [Chthonomonadales bacterium]
MRSETTPHARRYWAALVFLVLGVLLGVWHNRVTTHGYQDRTVGAVRGVVAPPVGWMGVSPTGSVDRPDGCFGAMRWRTTIDG